MNDEIQRDIDGTGHLPADTHVWIGSMSSEATCQRCGKDYRDGAGSGCLPMEECALEELVEAFDGDGLTVRLARKELAALMADKARLDFLEGEWDEEDRWRAAGCPLGAPNSLFRRNEPITRDAIDEARAALRGEQKETPDA